MEVTQLRMLMEEKHEGPSAELWHSTPVKKDTGGGAPMDASQPSVLSSLKMDNMVTQWAESRPSIPTDSSQVTEFPANDPSGSTVKRQRRELQLLMAELKDRDKELNAMVASHHKQLHAWEQDRQRAVSLEQRCARLDDELQKRNEVIRVLTKRVWVVESREEEVQKQLSAARQQLCELEHKQQNISQKCQDFEERNQSLNSTVMALSTQVGSLQVREEELSSMLKLKDKDAAEACGHVVDLTGRLRDLETSLTESHSRENKLLRESEENKRRSREARHETVHLKEELQQQITQSSTQREEIIRLKQELQLLRRDLALSDASQPEKQMALLKCCICCLSPGEGDMWRDELLELARSKHERALSELHCLRQVCENQRNDLQLLQLNLESSREALQEKNTQKLPGSQDELRCICLDSRRVKNSRPRHDAASPPAANLQSTVSSDLGLSSAHSIDGDDPLSSSSLQRLLDESKQLITSEHSTTRPHSCETRQKYHHHPNTPTRKAEEYHGVRPLDLFSHSICIHETSETPPKACPRHQPATWTNDIH